MKLINPLQDGNAYVYHYTSCDTALTHILRNKTLKINPFKNVNDPRESKHWDISPFVRAGLNLELKQYDAISLEVSQIIKSNAKLVCFSRDKPSAVKAWQPEALLNRGFAKPSMWHHYANGHNGVCLMFNREKLIKAFSEQLGNQHFFHGPVTYTDRGILPNLQSDPYVIDLLQVKDTPSYFAAIQAHFDHWHSHLFLHKLSDWSNEDEYRLVYLDEHSEPRYLEFGDSLEAIVIGKGIEKSQHEEYLRHCVVHEAEIAHLDWHNGYPRIGLLGQPYLTHRNLVDEQQSKK